MPSFFIREDKFGGVHYDCGVRAFGIWALTKGMSKNYFRSQLRRLGKGKEKSRVRSVPALSPETTPSASPVHAQVECFL